MKDVNKKLREAYFTALSLTSSDAYYQQAPDGTTGNYIVFQPLTIVPLALIAGTTVKVSVQVTVITEDDQYNNGDSADDIAGEVYQRILPDPTHTLSLGSAFDMSATELVNDTTQTWTLKDKTVRIDRVITFEHTIYIL